MNAKIIIASTLKPVIDSRAYEKIGKSIANTANFKIDILGSYPSTNKSIPGITLHPIDFNSKNLRQRLLLPWRIFAKIRRSKPDILIITTHELLFIGSIYKLISGNKLIYDIRENYYFNFLYQSNYSWGIKHLLGLYVRTKEIILSIFVDHFMIAEKCYQDEIRFIGSRYTLIENKFKATSKPLEKPVSNKVEFLLSGTISKEYGVFDAISFFKQFQVDEYRLIIIGHCPNKDTCNKLKSMADRIANIELEISTQPIPQSEILKKISTKTIGLLPYQSNKSTVNKMPTKLYEYIGLGIPVLISPNPIWAELIDKKSAGLSFDYNTPITDDHISVINALIQNTYLPDLKDIIREDEEIKLIDLIEMEI